jgi:hypothetical protein
MSRKRQKINNTEEMMDALVEDYIQHDELAQMEARSYPSQHYRIGH